MTAEFTTISPFFFAGRREEEPVLPLSLLMAGENEAAAAAGDISVETKALADGGEDVDEGGDGGDGGDCGDFEGLGSGKPSCIPACVSGGRCEPKRKPLRARTGS